MSRWKIEKDGTGIEKSGTGIEKSGTGIEKSGTGIEKSGTGIEKSGTGIRRLWLVSACAAAAFAGGLHASPIDPAGSLQVVVNRNTIAVSWIFDGSVFSGVSTFDSSFAVMNLTEVALAPSGLDVQVTGGGSGSSAQVTGGGSGSNAQVTGGGSGSNAQVTGGGSGSKAQVTGGGSGSNAQVTGGGSGSNAQVTGGGSGRSVQVTGGGSGSNAQVTGGGSGRSVQVTGGGSGSGREATIEDGANGEAIAVTLPGGTGLTMEVTVDCGFATVAVVDSMSAPVAFFARVPVVGDTGMCMAGYGGGFKTDPGRDFRLQ